METVIAVLIRAPILMPIYPQQAMATPTLSLNLFAVSGLTGLSVLQVAQTVNSRALVLPAAQALVTYQPHLARIARRWKTAHLLRIPLWLRPLPGAPLRWQSSKIYSSYISSPRRELCGPWKV